MRWRVGYGNFYAITRYNHSALYAMAVYELAAAVKQQVLSSDAQRASRPGLHRPRPLPPHALAAGSAPPGTTREGPSSRLARTRPRGGLEWLRQRAAACRRAAPHGASPSAERPSAGAPAHLLDVPDAIPRAEPRAFYGNPASYEVFGKRYYVMDSERRLRGARRGLLVWAGFPQRAHLRARAL